MIARVVALAALSASCTFTTRSQDYTCETNADCGGGRVCETGWCVVAGATIDAGRADADPSAPDADPFAPDAAVVLPPDAGPFVCPPECTSCVAGTCVITCTAAGSCSALPTVCPADMPCKIECIGDTSCGAAIDCSDATSCRIECTGPSSCAGAITCGEGLCRVECTAASTCAGGIDCLNACQCDTFCDGLDSCALPSMCPGASNCENAPECTSIPGSCNTC